MAVVKSIPSQRIINGQVQETSEISIVSEAYYDTAGESCVVVKSVDNSKLRLNSTTTDHVVVKALTKVLVIPDIGRVDEAYDEIMLDWGACVEFRFCAGNWYILSSDGLKQS
jgi:hypothetical protein